VTYSGVEGLGAALGDDGALRLRLERPAKRNALDDTLMRG